MVTYIRSDLDFILDQIKIAEEHARYVAGDPTARPLFGENGMIPANNISWGLRTVDGTFNNLVPGQEQYGSADQPFPHLLEPDYRLAPETADINGPAPGGVVGGGTYAPTPNSGDFVVDFDHPYDLESDRRHVARQPRRGGEGARSRGHRRCRQGHGDHQHRGGGRCLQRRHCRGRRHGGGHSRCPSSPAVLRCRGRTRDGRREPGHVQCFARRRSVGLVQLMVHPVRPVLRSWPRSGGQGQSGTVFIPLQPDDPLYVDGQPHELHGSDARHRRRPRATGRQTSPRPSSTRTRPTPRIPRTRSSCASTG